MFQVNKEDLHNVISCAKDWMLSHGCCMKSKSNYSEDSVSFVPFVLFPTPFSSQVFYKAKSLQKAVNELIHKVSCDDSFLRCCLESVLPVDSFTRNLFEIYDQVVKGGVHQNATLGVLRTDYFQSSPCSFKQVETNTIACSFGALSCYISKLHRFMLQEIREHDKIQHLPENKALQGICASMVKAWELYGNANAAILFLVEDVTYNICDQRLHEFEIKTQNPYIKIIRCTLTQVAAEDSRKDLEIALVYMRAGYASEHYPSEAEWSARLLIEQSKAIKCPSIHYQLAGTKKVQQQLSCPGVLEHFFDDCGIIEQLRQSFAIQYALDMKALRQPDQYVLKPQKEGGGNNLFDEQIVSFIKAHGHTNRRCSYILMERIKPPQHYNYLLQPNHLPQLCPIDSELGIFGCIIGNQKNILFNEEVGHILRTKQCITNESGISSGMGTLDSPYLVSDFVN